MTARQLLVVADGAAATGVGHHVRSTALARAAVARGWQVTFGIQPDTLPWVVDEVSRLGFGAADVDLGADLGVDLGAGLGVGSVVAAASAIAANGPVAVVVDTYRVDGDWLGELRPRLPGPLVLVDDLGDRALHADLVVNQNVGAEHLVARADPDTELLLGPRFALLRPEFAALRAQALARVPALGTHPRTVLVVMGGTDPTGSAPTVGQACADAFPDAEVTVVAPTPTPTQTAPLVAGGRVTVVPRIEDMAAAMLASDLVVSAGGSTVWELCCLAKASATVQVAANQADVYRRLTAAGVVAGLGTVPVDRADVADRLRAIVAVPDALPRLARAAAALVDGRGASRVVEHLDARMEGQPHDRRPR